MQPNETYCAWLGIGASTGDRIATMRSACRALDLHPKLSLTGTSAVYATSPVGPASQEFFNAALALRCAMTPHELLDLLLEIEHQHGRVRTIHWGDRSLDLDLLLMREHSKKAAWTERKGQTLTLPHPRIRERDFVLRPLLDLLPDLELEGTPAHSLLDQIDPKFRTIRRRLNASLIESQSGGRIQPQSLGEDASA